MGHLCTDEIQGQVDDQRGGRELWLHHQVLFHYGRWVQRLRFHPDHRVSQQFRDDYFQGNRNGFQRTGIGGGFRFHYGDRLFPAVLQFFPVPAELKQRDAG